MLAPVAGAGVVGERVALDRQQAIDHARVEEDVAVEDDQRPAHPVARERERVQAVRHAPSRVGDVLGPVSDDLADLVGAVAHHHGHGPDAGRRQDLELVFDERAASDLEQALRALERGPA